MIRLRAKNIALSTFILASAMSLVSAGSIGGAGTLIYTNTIVANTVYQNTNSLTMILYGSIGAQKILIGTPEPSWIGTASSFSTSTWLQVYNGVLQSNIIGNTLNFQITVPPLWYFSVNNFGGSYNAFFIEYIGTQNALTFNGNLIANNAVATGTTGFVGVHSGTNSIQFSTATGTTLNSNVAGNNAILTGFESAPNNYGAVAGSNTISATVITATTSTANVAANNAILTGFESAPNNYGAVAGSNTVSYSIATGTTDNANIIGNNAVFTDNVVAGNLFGNVLGTNILNAGTIGFLPTSPIGLSSNSFTCTTCLTTGGGGYVSSIATSNGLISTGSTGAVTLEVAAGAGVSNTFTTVNNLNISLSKASVIAPITESATYQFSLTANTNQFGTYAGALSIFNDLTLNSLTVSSITGIGSGGAANSISFNSFNGNQVNANVLDGNWFVGLQAGPGLSYTTSNTFNNLNISLAKLGALAPLTLSPSFQLSLDYISPLTTNAGGYLTCTGCTGGGGSYNAQYLTAIIAQNGIYNSVVGQTVTLGINAISPVTNTLNGVGCNGCTGGGGGSNKVSTIVIIPSR